MDRADVQDYCLTKPGSYLDEPWEDTVVVKVREKIFAFLGSYTGDTVGLKCGVDRHEADEWLEDFPDDATSMPYLGYRGWNSLRIGGAIPEDELLAAIDASYDLVVSKLPKNQRPLGEPRN
jgi:predicted DNA-binding protein (MmcQ/YjbR family)